MENKHSKYDLVKVVGANEPYTKDFHGAIGIITNVFENIEGPETEPTYRLIFAGQHHNTVSAKLGGYLFIANELEGI